jgi:hypothetical protein
MRLARVPQPFDHPDWIFEVKCGVTCDNAQPRNGWRSDERCDGEPRTRFNREILVPKRGDYLTPERSFSVRLFRY